MEPYSARVAAAIEAHGLTKTYAAACDLAGWLDPLRFL
jgi:hypothetical protein